MMNRLIDRHIIWMACRNLVARSGFGLSFMTFVSIAGVAVGVATLIVVLSVMGGFEESLRNKMLGSEPHLEVFATNAAAGFSLNELPVSAVKERLPKTTGLQAFTRADVVLKHRKHLQSAQLYGIDPNEKNPLWSFARQITDGDLAAISKLNSPIIAEDKQDHRWPGIALGEGMAGNLGVDVGDEIIVINPQAATDANAAMAGGTTLRHYVLVAIFRTGDPKYDSKVAMVSIDQGRKFMPDYAPFLDEEDYVTGIGVNLLNPYAAEGVEKSLAKFPDIQVVTWQTANKSLLFALKLEKFAMGSILMLIVVVAAFSISGTMMMTVFHKRMQVSVLRALGMTQFGIAKLYLAHGFVVGTIGITLGLLVGLLICWYIPQSSLLALPPGIYYQNRLPVKFLPDTYIVVCLSAWVFSLIASTYPALTAARQNPSAGLRYE